MDVESLAAKYGSGGGDNSSKQTDVVTTPFADLINKYGSGGAVAPTTPVVAVEPSYIPQPGRFTDAEIKASQNQPSKPTPFTELPIIRQGIQGFKEGNDLASSGYNDINHSLSATGVGKVVLGHAQQILNATGILPTIKQANEIASGFVGKPTADKMELVVTSGLPIMKAGSVLAKSFPSARAIDTLVNNIGKDNLYSVVEQLKSNPRLSLMDVDPNAQILAQGLAAQPGAPRNVLDKSVKGRTGSQKDAVISSIDDAMGVPPNIKQTVDRLKTDIKKVGAEINPIVKNTNPVDLSYVIAHIDGKSKPGVNSVISAGEPLPNTAVVKELEDFKKYLTDGKSTRTDAQQLHQLQSSLRYRAQGLMDSQNPEQRQVGYHLMQVRNKIVEAIDHSSPKTVDAAGNAIGSYKPALAKYRDVNDIEDAFSKGQLITRNKMGRLEDHPEYWKEWISNATPQELTAAREGARLAVEHQMKAFRFAARKGMEVPEAEFNAEKLKLLFGEKEVSTMMKALSDERKIADTNQKLFANSMTAMRTLGADATKVRDDYRSNFSNMLPVALEAGAIYASGGNVLGAGMLAGHGYQAARKGMTKLGQSLDRKTNVEIANLTSATGEAREALIKALENHIPKPKQSMLQKTQNLMLPIAAP